MYEIIIHRMDKSGLNYVGKGLELPASPEAISEYAIRQDEYYGCFFRLEELNDLIVDPSEAEKLNVFAKQLANLSEYERVKLAGAVIVIGCKTIDGCTTFLHNLDKLEITPNIGSHEALGHHLAANDYAESLKFIQPEIMEHFDYTQLGRISWDEHTNVFVEGHRVRYNGQELRVPDLNRDPLACCLKMRLCSNANPDGVWVKFPLYAEHEIPADSPEGFDETRVALASLGVESLDECRAVECVSGYPGLERCIETHAGEPVCYLIWKANNFGYAESYLSQYGKDAYAKLAAALEYENCTNLDFAVDISQNLNCYDFAPDIESYAGNYLLEQGVDNMIASCFDRKAIGEMLELHHDTKQTVSGIISRNFNKFVFDYHQPRQEEPTHTQTTTIRLFCPLEVKTDPESSLGEEYGICENANDYATIPNNIADYYKDAILAAIEKEWHDPGERERGLALYVDDSLKQKVHSIFPTVDTWAHDLYGVVKIETTEELTSAEMADLTDWCVGQFADGFGESFEQHPVSTRDGDIYVSFWQSGKDYFLMPEQEFKGQFPEQQQYHGPTMGGMY